MRSEWLVIARREFLERVRTKWFIIGTLLGPIGMLAMILVPALIASGGGKDVRLQIIDHSDKLGAKIASDLKPLGWKAEVVPSDTTTETWMKRIANEEIDGVLKIEKNATGMGGISYRGDNGTNQMVVLLLREIVVRAVQEARGQEAGIPDDKLSSVLMPVMFTADHTTGDMKETSGSAAFIVGYAVMFILYMAILLYCANVLRSIVQEKTSRVVELLVAAAKPHSLLLGKILGVGAVGLVQMAVWLGMALALMHGRGTILGWFGVSGAGGVAMPTIGGLDVAVILAYFLLGDFFYASLHAAVGAMVSSDQESQQAQTPLVMLLVIPIACFSVITNDPRGLGAQILTTIPFSSPILMPMRYLLGGATPAQLALSLGILALSMAGVVWLAARIYRVGILMYGKRPTLRELARWTRYG